MQQLSGFKNEKILALRRLIADSSERAAAGLAVCEGLKLCLELPRSGLKIQRIFLTENMLKTAKQELSSLLSTSVEFFLIPNETAKRVSSQKTPQGIFTVFQIPETPDVCSVTAGRYVLLDQLQDPGNLGAVLRSAEAFSMDGAIVTNGCADCFSPKVLRSSMGSALRIRIHRTPDPVQALRQMQKNGFGCFQASPDGKNALETNLPQNLVLVIGSEGRGISPEISAVCPGLLGIPMKDTVESLNAAVAAGILMFQINTKKGE